MVDGATPTRADEPVGIFDGHVDVGTVLHAGSVAHDPASGRYVVAGSGENMWSTLDAFHYAWKRASGDLSIAADVAFEGAGTDPHRKALAYCARRDGEFDIYTIPAEGGTENRLTTARGLDDGPEYAPDGKSIYFNSDRTGTMQIYRMKPDGSDQEALTSDDFNNWFAHPSPDGRTLVFLSFEKGVVGHPENQHVTLRRMALDDRKIDVLGRFFGGQGTINVPCWSLDGKRIAFVTYQFVP